MTGNRVRKKISFAAAFRLNSAAACLLLLRAFFFAFFCAAAALPEKAEAAQTVNVDARYRSPKNKSRPVRKSTRFIILHTTEGAARGALEKLSRNGECHYVVNKDGKIYSIIDRSRVAYHAGLSMWNGRTGLDSVSIGIEVVGYHNADITDAQYSALRNLLGYLKDLYDIPDSQILTHSMVAYGKPNRWQKKNHRGRKRCGMLLALPSSRSRMGLTGKPYFDPDVKAGRLADADPELSKILYSKPSTSASAGSKIAAVAGESNVIGPGRTAWDIARDLYNSPDTIYIFPDGTRKNGRQIKKWKAMPTGTRVEIGAEEENPVHALMEIGIDGTPSEIAGDEKAASTTFYFPPGDGKSFKSGATMSLNEIDSLPDGTKVLVGYTSGGPVSPRTPVFNICGLKWNRPETFYLCPSGKLISGDKIDEKNIPAGARVFFIQ